MRAHRSHMLQLGQLRCPRCSTPTTDEHICSECFFVEAEQKREEMRRTTEPLVKALELVIAHLETKERGGWSPLLADARTMLDSLRRML